MVFTSPIIQRIADHAVDHRHTAVETSPSSRNILRQKIFTADVAEHIPIANRYMIIHDVDDYADARLMKFVDHRFQFADAIDVVGTGKL